jgi:TM2 domain-containing membrane protein YozV
MRCVNHPETDVQSYCQNCGKPLCASCVRTTPGGQLFCETCVAAAGTSDPSQAYWHGAANIPPLYGIPTRGPNPSAAALLGLIPGVGAMYNGQLFKGLIHVVIFAVLVSITDHYAIFGLFIAAWVLYQSFEAYHTAKARRDGMPVPDPFGLNELGSWLNLGGSGRSAGVPPGANTPPTAAAYAQTEPPPYSAPYTSSWSEPIPGAGAGTGSGAGPIPPPYPDPYAGTNPGGYAGGYAEGYPPGVIPPIPPVPPYNWRRREPIFAFVLIGLGIIFLLQSLGFVTHLMHYIWPLMLIGLGVWLIVRRVGYIQGGSK